MSFQTIPIKGYDNDEIIYESKPYPKPKLGSNLPFLFFVCLLIGSTGSGKTNACIKLLKAMERYKYYNENNEVVPQRVWIFSPTIDANEVYYTLKNLDEGDIITNYSDGALLEALEEIKQINKDAEEYQEKLKVWKKFQKAKSLLRFSAEEIILLDMMNYEAPPIPAYPIAPINHIVLDDLLAQPNAFKPNGNSAISNLTVKCRHLRCNVFVLGQTSSQIPKLIRTQARLLMLYRFNSKKITTDLYEVVSNMLTPEEFEQIYADATAERHNFLCVDNTGSNLVLKKNLNFLIKIKKKRKTDLKDEKDIKLSEDKQITTNKNKDA